MLVENYRSEDAETDELGPHALRKRALKSRRKKKESTQRADPKCEFCNNRIQITIYLSLVSIVYHGPRARYHYFQCLQLLLRQQISALTSLWKLPPEFEVRFYLIDEARHLRILRSCVEMCGHYISAFYQIPHRLNRFSISMKPSLKRRRGSTKSLEKPTRLMNRRIPATQRVKTILRWQNLCMRILPLTRPPTRTLTIRWTLTTLAV